MFSVDAITQTTRSTSGIRFCASDKALLLFFQQTTSPSRADQSKQQRQARAIFYVMAEPFYGPNSENHAKFVDRWSMNWSSQRCAQFKGFVRSDLGLLVFCMLEFRV